MPAALMVHPLPKVLAHVPYNVTWPLVAWLQGLVSLQDISIALLTCMPQSSLVATASKQSRELIMPSAGPAVPGAVAMAASDRAVSGGNVPSMAPTLAEAHPAGELKCVTVSCFRLQRCKYCCHESIGFC